MKTAVAEPNDTERAFRHVVMTWTPVCYRVLSLMGASKADIDDVLQDVFKSVWENRVTPRDPKPYLIKACLLRLKHVRRTDGRKERKHVQLAHEQLVTHAPSIDDATSDRRLLGAFLDTLTADERRLFVLHFVEELPIRDIEAILRDGTWSITWGSRSTIARRLQEMSAKLRAFAEHHARREEVAHGR